jgi:hypothetical protein
VQIEPPLDFRATLDFLAEWVGREVLVIAHSQAPGEPMSHSQVTMRGTLGEIQMLDNRIDETVHSVAALKVGHEVMNAVYLSPGDFVHTMKLPERKQMNITFAHDFHIEVQLAG